MKPAFSRLILLALTFVLALLGCKKGSPTPTAPGGNEPTPLPKTPTYAEFVGIYYSIEGESVVIEGMKDSNATNIVIPDEIEGKPVTMIASNALPASVQTVYLPKTPGAILETDFASSIALVIPYTPSASETPYDAWSSVTRLPSGLSVTNAKLYYTGTAVDIVVPYSINGMMVTNIFSNAFKENASLNAFLAPYITAIDEGAHGSAAFLNCTSLKDVSLPSLVYFGYGAFSTCTTATNISLPNVMNIPTYAFDYTYVRTNESFPSATNVGEYAFHENYALQNISIPNATHIGVSAFYDCTNLVSAEFGALTAIENSAFRSCGKLAVITINGDAPTVGVSVFPAHAKTLRVPLNASGYDAWETTYNFTIERF